MIVLLAIAVWACVVMLVLVLCVSARDGDLNQEVRDSRRAMPELAVNHHARTHREAALTSAGRVVREVQRTEAA